MSRRVTNDGLGAFQIRFPYDPRLRKIVRELPSRLWNPDERYWSVPEQNVVAVVNQLHPEGFTFCARTQRLYHEHGGDLVFPKQPETTSGLTVSQLNERVRGALTAAFPASIWLIGEISGFDKAAHKRIIDFELVERDTQGKEDSKLRVVLFPEHYRRIERQLAEVRDSFRLGDEVQVRVRGRVDIYVPWGSYRLLIEEIDPSYTLGEAARRRDKIRRKLAAEGILDRNRALPFPVLPLRVGLIASLSTDGYIDVIRTLQESGFAFQVTAHDARVQGWQTEPSVLRALDFFKADAANFDAVLICRGGGARTDLAWFDSEVLARAVATFPIPVVVGIGHERDFSALDDVGWRSKTPTAAAQRLVVRVSEAMSALESRLQSILDQAGQILESASSNLEELAGNIPHEAKLLIESTADGFQQAVRQLCRDTQRDLASASRRLDTLASRLGPHASSQLARESERVEARKLRLLLLDPRRVVERGYAILRTETGAVLKDPAQAPSGTLLTAELKRGTLRIRSEGPEKT